MPTIGFENPKNAVLRFKKYKNRPFRAKNQIFGNSVFLESTIRLTPKQDGRQGGWGPIVRLPGGAVEARADPG